MNEQITLKSLGGGTGKEGPLELLSDGRKRGKKNTVNKELKPVEETRGKTEGLLEL